MTVIPLAMPQIDESALDTIYNEIGLSPKRELDAKSIKASDPKRAIAYLKQQHLFYVLALRVQQPVLDEIDFGSLSYSVHPVDYMNKIVIFSATLDILVAYTIQWMVRTATPHQRNLATQIFRIFRAAGIASPWDEYDTNELPDKTMILRRTR